jgi:hypothetical protein
MGGVPTTAHAANGNHSGTICKNYNAGQALDIDYLANGTRNLASSPRFVICPLVTAGTGSLNTNLFVDGYAAPGQTIFCTVYSYSYKGAFLGSKSFPSAMTGTFDVYLSVPDGTVWGGLSVLCELPPSGQGVIYDINVEQ